MAGQDSGPPRHRPDDDSIRIIIFYLNFWIFGAIGHVNFGEKVKLFYRNGTMSNTDNYNTITGFLSLTVTPKALFDIGGF